MMLTDGPGRSSAGLVAGHYGQCFNVTSVRAPQTSFLFSVRRAPAHGVLHADLCSSAISADHERGLVHELGGPDALGHCSWVPTSRNPPSPRISQRNWTRLLTVTNTSKSTASSGLRLPTGACAPHGYKASPPVSLDSLNQAIPERRKPGHHRRERNRGERNRAPPP
jgi:hypothetical protein